MRPTNALPRLALPILLFLALTAAFSAGVWRFAFQSALVQLAERGESDLLLASDRLLGELQQYREIAVLTADRTEMLPALSGQSAEAAHRVLQKTGDKTGTLEMRLVRADGRVVASSERNINPVDRDRSDSPAFLRAMQGALGAHHARVEGVAGRAYTFSAPVFGAGLVIGVVEVDVDAWQVEAEWLSDPEPVLFTDAAGVVFISNRTELLLRTRGQGSENPSTFGYKSEELRPFPAFRPRQVGGYELWQIDGGPYLPEQALHLTRELPTIRMTGELLLNTQPATRIAALQSLVAGAVALIFGGALLLVSERRRALSIRLEVEAAANAELERRVAERTAELKQAQNDLVQASKLSALGQMSAGISHELNQPLMAIQSFADNGAAFLERGNTGKASDNLGRIAQMAARMARIIKNLRAFARNESEPMGRVDLVAVIAQAIEITEARLARDGITLDWQPPKGTVLAYGGEVRLGQVFVNLITNAADAMMDMEPRAITITLTASDRLRVTIRDTGPGISEPDKIFDPFYSTKAVGSSEGMGLGLSISYGLVQSFGGNIRGENAPGGGAAFTVELERWRSKVAA
ncbi:hypothetical protein ACMU_12400 [Actibacterium mucosum KCTC 23349]|uniref:C4-dicarboxylate transport sensor protein DctB n=1 Tax=Actibacterium mucosum KCTC 23349 TaxID=1454373 RepID=A0A037ZIX3_9RHOB|nr:ATP-binding protein [Actibacterium mucosum]KAJ55487.1 hypothetical protein ACMU_12400 [Actibacterium mucosum KCTC 23349]